MENQGYEDDNREVFTTIDDVMQQISINSDDFEITEDEAGEIVGRMAAESTEYVNTGWGNSSGFRFLPQYSIGSEDITAWEKLETRIWDEVLSERPRFQATDYKNPESAKRFSSLKALREELRDSEAFAAWQISGDSAVDNLFSSIYEKAIVWDEDKDSFVYRPQYADADYTSDAWTELLESID